MCVLMHVEEHSPPFPSSPPDKPCMCFVLAGKLVLHKEFGKALLSLRGTPNNTIPTAITASVSTINAIAAGSNTILYQQQ